MDGRMKETKWTPGPWSKSWIRGGLRHLNRNVDYDAFWLLDDGEDRDAANIPSYYYGNDVDLIAAAPELYDALTALYAWAKETNAPIAYALVKQVNEALEKAGMEPAPVRSDA